MESFRAQKKDEDKALITGICLNACRHFTGANIIEEGNILSQNCLEVAFSDTFGIDLPGIHPDILRKLDEWWGV